MDTCSCDGKTTLIFACSGGSNVGQISNEAAKTLHNAGEGRMYCTGGIGGGIPGLVKTAQEADEVIGIDGCAVGCVKAVLAQKQVPMSRYVVITELGIEKAPTLVASDEQIAQVCSAVRESAQ